MRIGSAVLVGTVLLGLIACGNPAPGSGVRVTPGVGILDYYTLRSIEGGVLTTRDLPPEPRPREAITGDDYFQLKLEHIYIGEALGQEVGNVAIITQIEGIVPDQVHCAELDMGEIELTLNQRERANLATTGCAFKHVVAINPVFSNGHVTFDSAFITPPFRMGMQSIGLRFIIAQLNDYELARQILDWAEERVNLLDQEGDIALNGWQSEIINIGFTVANYILDYASRPDYVFEYETDFVPVEVVGGVTTPQNLFAGGDYVLVGFPRPTLAELMDMDEEEAAAAIDTRGAMVMSQRLAFDSGRLYWRDTGVEYRDGAYIVFKVVREARFPDELPVNLARFSRQLERGEDPQSTSQTVRNAVLDLQDLRVLNETEGRYLLDLFDWFADARTLEAEVEGAAFDGDRPSSEGRPAALAAVPDAVATDLALVPLLDRVRASLERLDERIYENYGRNPGMWQAECVAVRNVTQGLVDGYERLRPEAQRAFETLQVSRNQLTMQSRRSADQEAELRELEAAELWAAGMLEDLPGELSEPACPALRQ